MDSTKMTSYQLLLQENWRVSYTENLPDVSIEKLFEEIRQEAPRFQVPVEISVIEVVTSEDSSPEKRLLIKHKNAPYHIFHILIGLKNFGTFVFASRWNCLIKEPSAPEGEPKSIPSRVGLIASVFVGAFLILYGLLALFAALSEPSVLFCATPALLVGLALGIYGTSSWKSRREAIAWNNELEHRKAKYNRELTEYWSNLNRALLSQFDPTIYHLTDAAGEIINIVLRRLYPQAQIADPQKIDDSKEVLRALKERRESLISGGKLKEA